MQVHFNKQLFPFKLRKVSEGKTVLLGSARPFDGILFHNMTIGHNHLSLAIAENSETEYESEAEEVETNVESLDITTNNDSDNVDQNDFNSDISEG